MDDQAYLNSISSQVRPQKAGSKGLLGSPLIKIVIGGIVAMILVVILSSVFSGGGGDSLKEKSVALKLHIDNTLTAIKGYQPSVKSSILRSSSASLASILSNTTRDLTNYLVAKYKYKDGSKENAKLKERAQLHQDGLISNLFDASISGRLDRMYALEIAYEIELIMAEEATIYDKTKDEAMKSILESSYNSLSNLYPNFDDFSESK